MKFLKSYLLTLLICCYSWNVTVQRQDRGCVNNCGNISIPYPFGIGPEHCYKDPYFEVSCINSSSSPSSQIMKPFLKILNYEIVKVSHSDDEYFGEVTVQIPSLLTVCSSNSTGTKVIWKSQNLAKSPLKFSYSNNAFASVGCEGYAVLYNETGRIIAACTSDCSPNPPAAIVGRRECYGYHCCQANFLYLPFLKESLNQYSIYVGGFVNNNTSRNCRSAFLISKRYLQNNAATLGPGITAVHVVLQWEWDINPSTFFKKRNCITASSSYSHTFHRTKICVTGISLAIIILPCVCLILIICGCCRGLWRLKTKKHRKEIQLRKRYFKHNLKFLNQQRSCSTDDTNKIKLFTLAELKRCTDNFNKDRVLGQGGQGTVYKGMLRDGQVIAVKKSRALDQSQWKPFINEIILLSEIKHKHVVRILGCCLEGDYPLVVYEFICNGNLSEHIQHSIDEELIFTWEMRLRIAYEVATAITYLHSEFSTPIYHRDIKSSNVLLDDKFRGKLSDFGISRAVCLDQTHLTTCVRGTLGYLDPQYFYSSQYSEKSDVYSFGVILVELLTGQKPIRSEPLDDDEESKDHEEEPSLVMYFISSINDSTLLKIVDPLVLTSGRIEEIMEFAKLAKLCFNPRRLERPSMKEVTVVLERLRCDDVSNQMPHPHSDVQVSDWHNTSMEIDNAYVRSNTCDHIEHLDSVDVFEMRLLHTT